MTQKEGEKPKKKKEQEGSEEFKPYKEIKRKKGKKESVQNKFPHCTTYECEADKNMAEAAKEMKNYYRSKTITKWVWFGIGMGFLVFSIWAILNWQVIVQSIVDMFGISIPDIPDFP